MDRFFRQLWTRRRVIDPPLVALAIFVALPGCSSSPPSPTTVSGVVVSGNPALTSVGQTVQLTATATFSDGSTQNVTSTATWVSSNTGVVTVSPAGLVTAVNFGPASITATFQGASGPLAVTVQLNLSGTWKGSTADSTGVLQVTFVLAQNGSTVTGTGTFTGGAVGSGTFTGTVSTTSNTINFSIGGTGGGCTVSATGVGTVIGSTFSGTYNGTNSCLGPLANGVVALTKQ